MLYDSSDTTGVNGWDGWNRPYPYPPGTWTDPLYRYPDFYFRDWDMRYNGKWITWTAPIDKGWECPRCNRIYAPNVKQCKKCNKAISEKG